ncbi:MAG: penicillin-binding protein 2, partial [Candidatus Omnitrophica bacterium]|nr:penicillin-binding protein 2 [Candidatus Omnitrophota bacterium]
HTIFIVLFILLAACLFYLQIIKGQLYGEMSHRNSIRLLNIPAPRGIIYDRNGVTVADNAVSFGVFIVPQEARDLDVEIKRLAGILGVSESLLWRNYKRNYQAPFAPCELIRNVSKEKGIIIEELRLDMPGVLVKEIPVRRYLYGEAAAHLTGYVGEISKKELELLKSYGYNLKDFIGKDGIEKAADSYLRGHNGGMQIQVDNRGRQVKVLNSRKPRPGRDVSLSIDIRLQEALWKMMKGKAGAACFMDPRSGEVLALVSSPSFDPNNSLGAALTDKETPLLNRAIMGQYPPGSLFKIVIALSGLESEKLRPETTFTCHGKLKVGVAEFNCWNRDGHGPMDLRHAITESCNVYFYNTGLLLGVEAIHQSAGELGFGEKTGIDLFGENQGFLPSRAWKMRETGEAWYAGDTANLSIGQGFLSATPLQALRMIACVANGGELVEPVVLKKIGDVDAGAGGKIGLKLKKKNIDAVKRGMRDVVKEGTGFRAWSNIVSISGKTGTSQPGGGLETHAWFGGFAPSESPEICFVVFLEHGGSGGDMTAMIAKKAVEFWFKR